MRLHKYTHPVFRLCIFMQRQPRDNALFALTVACDRKFVSFEE